MENMQSLLSMDNAMLVVIIYFMTLWHKRTMARDSAFFESQKDMAKMLKECFKFRVSTEDEEMPPN